MVTPFPLLSVPHVVFDIVHKYFEIPEIILLSQCSRNLERILKSNENSRKGTSMSAVVVESGTNVTVTLGSQTKFTWTLGTERDMMMHGKERFFSWHIDGVDWKVARTDLGWLSVPEDGRFERDVLLVVGMLKRLFNGPFDVISLDFKADLDFDKLILSTDLFHKARRVSVGEFALRPSEMTFLLDHLVAEELIFNGYAGKLFSYQKPFNYSKLSISTATWVGFETLVSMSTSCRQICLESATLITDGVLNKFLSNWMASDNRTLETVYVSRTLAHSISLYHYPPPTDPFVQSAILDGIPTIPGAKKRPNAAKYFKRYYHYENGVDIRRGDGVLATVLFHGDTGFRFTVWYDANPNE